MSVETEMKALMDQLKSVATAAGLSESSYYLIQLLKLASGQSSDAIDDLVAYANDNNLTAGLSELNAHTTNVETISGGAVLVTIEDEGELGGEYNGSVLCLGESTITDDLVVRGNLICLGDIMNPGGHSVEIFGDFLINEDDVEFTPYSLDTIQGNVTIHGDFHFGSFEMNVNPNQEGPQLTVYGDLINTDDSNFDGDGQVGGHGLNVRVMGDVIVEYMSLSGGDATDTLTAGSGGYLNVLGDMITYDGLEMNGGSSSFNGQSAGSGGYLEVVGDFSGYVNMNGGNANANCNAGNGGEADVYGVYNNYWCSYNGGNCSSTASTHVAGRGGNIYASMILGDSFMSLNGGTRSGTLTEGDSSTSSPDGGEIDCMGSMYCSHVELHGGSNEATFEGVANSNGGSGGSIDCKGDIIFWYLGMNGGSSNGRDAGRGGQVKTKGKLTINYELEARGGDTGGAVAGSGGLITAKGGMTCHYVSLVDGGGEASAPSDTCGVKTAGSAQIYSLDLTDRANVIVQSWYPDKIAMSIAAMPNKKTLTQPNGDATVDISESLGSSLFLYDPNDGWHVIQGESLAVV